MWLPRSRLLTLALHVLEKIQKEVFLSRNWAPADRLAQLVIAIAREREISGSTTAQINLCIAELDMVSELKSVYKLRAGVSAENTRSSMSNAIVRCGFHVVDC